MIMRHINRHLGTAPLLFLLLLTSSSLQAGPAPWYLWRSKIDGQYACSQTPLGPGWEQDRGPYKDSRCEKPLLAK
jgi:hypothetical protein